MDQLPALGTAASVILAPTIQIYKPLLQANAAAIRSTPREEFAYGSHPRQKLDVYPAHDEGKTVNGSPSPILAFFYGGAFTRGAKRAHLIPDDLLYANLGHFYASRGYTVVVADYRLAILPTEGSDADKHGAKFPDCGEDIALSVEWIRTKLCGDAKRDFFLMATSAGGSHLATFMFHPLFAATRVAIDPSNPTSTLQLKGVIYSGAVLDLNCYIIVGKKPPPAVLGVRAYYGRDESQWAHSSPLGLLVAAQKEPETVGPIAVPTLMLVAPMDPETVIWCFQDFTAAWDEKTSGRLDKYLINGHNHFSSIMGLATGIEREELWGLGVMEWMKDQSVAGLDAVAAQPNGAADAIAAVGGALSVPHAGGGLVMT